MDPDDQTIKSDVGPHSESYGGCRRKVMMSNVVTLSEQPFPTCNTCCFYGALVSTICITYMYYEAMEEIEELGNDQLNGIFMPCAQENCKQTPSNRFSNQAVELVRQWCKSSSISIKPLRVLEKTYFLMLA